MAKRLSRQFDNYEEPSPESDRKVPLAREKKNNMTNWRFERARARESGTPRWWRAASR